MENLENNVVNNEVQENTDVEAKEVKTFTQDELNKIVAERIAKEKKKLEAERLKQQEIQEKLIEEESEKLAKMTEAEKVKAKAERERRKFEEKVARYEAEMKAFEQEKIKNQTMKLLGEKGLPVELCQFIQSNTADEIMENVEVFEKCWSEAIEKTVTERLRGSAPKVAVATNGITKEEFKKMKDEDPYVKVGDRVEQGDVICIVEAMKLMNEIHAPHSGVVTEILVENEAVVEYKQPLIRID